MSVPVTMMVQSYHHGNGIIVVTRVRSSAYVGIKGTEREKLLEEHLASFCGTIPFIELELWNSTYKSVTMT